MKKQRLKRSGLILLADVICSLSLRPLCAQIHEAVNDRSPVLNLAVSTEGQVAIKRKGWVSYAPVVFGTNLLLGDLLKVGESSSVKVVCSDLKIRDITAGMAGVPCPASPAFLRAPDGSRINVTRSNGASLMVLAPRKTKVLSTHPLLRWTPVEGATTYTVIVRAENFYWSRQVNAITELQYPEDAPRLQPGVVYKAIVRTADKSSESEAGLGLGFSILDPGEKKIVEDEQREVESLGLPDGPTQFILAHLYAAHGLESEAIQRLELVSGSFKVAAVDRSLGDFYLQVGLVRDAEKYYLNSLDISTPESDAEGQMRSHLALAHIYRHALGNRKMASQHFDAALALARQIGDDLVIAEAAQQSAELKTVAGP